MQRSLIELPAETRWQVTRAGGVTAYTEPGGSVVPLHRAEALPPLRAGDEVDVSAECGLWVQLRQENLSPAWVEMDAFFAG